jgi:hypothetical protein
MFRRRTLPLLCPALQLDRLKAHLIVHHLRLLQLEPRRRIGAFGRRG